MLAALILVIAAQGVVVLYYARRVHRAAQVRPEPPPIRPGVLPDLAHIGHELRTPLNSVLTLSQLLDEGSAGPLNDSQQSYVRVIRRNSQSLLAMISDILDLARIERGEAGLRLGSVDVQNIARDVIRSLTPRAAAKSIALVATFPRGMPFVRADEDRLRQVLAGVIGSTIQLASHGEVAVSAELAGGNLVLRVSSTDGVLPDETRAALAAAPPPLGRNAEVTLSLVLSRALVALMGGHLTATAEDGHGATFVITLPAAPGTTTAAEEGQRVTARRSREGTRPGPDEEHAAGGRVLIIDDDDGERQHAADLLEAAGYQVTLAASGREGLELMRREPFHAVVLDMVMPDLTGLDVLRAAQREHRLAEVPFVILSAMFMTWTERDVLGPAVVGVVQKGPPMAEHLAPAVRKAIGRGHAVHPGEGARP